MHVVGNLGCLGSWKPDRAHKLNTDKNLYPKWKSQSSVFIHQKEDTRSIEYKYIILNPNNTPNWEGGNNRTLDLSGFFD